MSKTNSLKKKTTGFDIMYRVVTAILAIAIFPAVYFADIFTFEILHSDISNLLNKFTGESTGHATYDSLSLYEIPEFIDMFGGVSEDFDFKASILQNELYRPVIIAVVFLALALVLGLVVLGFAIFSNKSKVIAAISGTGFLCTLASYISFTEFFAKPIISGEISLAKLFNMESSLFSLVLPYLGEVTVFTLTDGFFAAMFLLLGICVWSFAIIIVNAGEEKEQQTKKTSKVK